MSFFSFVISRDNLNKKIKYGKTHNTFFAQVTDLVFASHDDNENKHNDHLIDRIIIVVMVLVGCFLW